MKLFLVAGEPSGDRLGGALLAGFDDLGVAVEPAGVGGPIMAAQGMRSLFPYEELAVMGLAEVLPKYRALKRRIVETAQAVADSDAEALITIDSPDFGLRVAKRARAANPRLKTIHYVAPSVWAWRPKRAEKMARVIDHVLALLPFEPPYMEAAGMSCDFVGHPVVAEPRASASDVAAFRAAYGLGAEPIVLVLPGSRSSEVARLAPIFGEALSGIDARLVLPTLPHTREAVLSLTADWPQRPIIVDAADADQKRAAFAAADVALAASGTVSLELAANGTPMVIAYDMNWLTRAIMKRAIRIDTVTLVNLVSETRAVPEYLAENCRPDAIREGVRAVMAGDHDQQAAMALTMERLGQGQEPPGTRAARSVLAALGKS
ncbi:lipid-A-disaccharide synthase [Gymnodinialimonas ceratoperidinii]|uniref:Lipid-A-disaccharide synthase n=1 Tax=Gymnodinialimonas ceratoperidinii TaxID=2856823 RepID=A0A8F6YA11_9RHOB|nr:lipid-A-disaccharide synthase [Gymnodinialimonas ceratoperidinii]QXT38466.1 lipid-A-disaccharide synthase [Gymnodinialimonas ceratoperidinii]